MKYNKTAPVIILILLCFVFLLLLICNIPRNLASGAASGEQIYDNEPLWRGTVAKDLLDGLRSDTILKYQYTAYEGGSLVVGILMVPAFLLFGDSFFSLSLVPIGFALMTLVMCYLMLLRYWGRTVAVLTGFLMITVPPQFAFRQIAAYGNHVESIFFSVLLLLLFCVLQDTKSSKNQLLLVSCFGFIAGFGCYFCYVVAIQFIVCCVFILSCMRKEFTGVHAVALVLSFFAGFSPWLMFNSVNNFSGLLVPSYDSSGVKHILLDVLSFDTLKQSMSSFLLAYSAVKDAFYIRDVGAEIGFYLFIGLCGVSFLFMVCKHVINGITNKTKRASSEEKKQICRERLVLTYCIVYILLWSLYPVDRSAALLSHYLYPLYPFIFILIGNGIQNIYTAERKRFRHIRTFLTVFFVLCVCCIGVFNVQGYNIAESAPHVLDAFRVKGYSLEFMNRFYRHQTTIYLTDYCEAEAVFIEKVLPGGNDPLFNYYQEIQAKDKYALFKDYALLKNMPLFDMPPMYLMLGLSIGDGLSAESFYQVPLVLTNIDNAYCRHFIYEGIALSLLNRQWDEINNMCSGNNALWFIPKAYRHYAWTEFGRRIAEHYSYKLNSALPLIDSYEDSVRQYILRGFLWSAPVDMLTLQRTTVHGGLPEEMIATFYRQWGRSIEITTEQQEIRRRLADMPLFCRDYFLQGLGWGYIEKKVHLSAPEHISAMIRECVSIMHYLDEKQKASLYEGIGRGVSLKTYGFFDAMHQPMFDKSTSEECQIAWYCGYGEGIRLRYGNDSLIINSLLAKVPFKKEE